VVACVINLLLIFALVPAHGAMGAALATLFGNASAGALAALFLRRSFGLAVKPFYGLHRGDLALILGVSRRVVRNRLSRPGGRSGTSG
jgi:Na+-driven multidrug efflux pump